MKAEELMLNDWLYAIDGDGVKHPCRVGRLDYDSTNRLDDIFLDFRDSDFEPEFPDVLFNIEPMPVTPEILEKNGFVKQDFDGWEYMEPDDNAPHYLAYRILWRTDYDNHLFIEKFTASSIGRLQVLNVKYVHQLQQALRIFSINKDIKL